MSTSIGIREAALQLGVSVQWVRNLCRDGLLKAEKIGSSWVIEQSYLNKYQQQIANEVAEDHPAYNVHEGNSRKPIALSFFSGALGLDLGIENAGFDIRLVCENDKYCRETITTNRPNPALLADINNYQPEDILEKAQLSDNDEIGLIVGGPPCQAFSTAGKRNAFNDERGNVFVKFIDLALNLKPKYLVIENVRGLLSCPMEHRPHNRRGEGYPDLAFDELKGGALNFIINRLKNSGYSYSFNLYNSANFGTPQVRERVIIICSRDGDKPPYLVPTHSQNGEFDLPKWKTLKQAIFKIKNHTHLNFPEKRLKYYRLLKPGQNWKNLPEDLQKEAMGKSYYSGGGKTGFLRRLAWTKPAPTLVTHPAMPATDLSHPSLDRPLSIEEYKKIQEFPSNWKLAGPLIQQYKQVGNAVPVSLGYAVGKLVMDLLENKAIPSFPNFKYSRYKKSDDASWEHQFIQQANEASQANRQLKAV